MSKKILTLCLSLFVGANCFSQVGIGTTDPQQDLHIAGSSSSIRIDGLNQTNNANNYGTRPVPVHANADGDLIAPGLPASAEIIHNGENFITSTNYWERTGSLGETWSGEIYRTSSFTLTQPALISIHYSLGMSVRQWGTNLVVRDGKPKILSSWLELGDGTTADPAKRYGSSSQTYTCSAPGGHVIDGFLYNTASDAILLPAGTYSFHMYFIMSNHNGAPGGLASDAYRVILGSTPDEYLKVIANY